VTAEFANHVTGEIKSQTVFMGDFPIMTAKGTFIVNGTRVLTETDLTGRADPPAAVRARAGWSVPGPGRLRGA
jgi:hypothetical protein